MAVVLLPMFVQQTQLVIPRTVREALRIRPGQKVQVVQYENRVELIPIRPTPEMRGFLKGIDTAIERESYGQ